MRKRLEYFFCLGIFLITTSALAQEALPALAPVPAFSLQDQAGLRISHETDPQRPFSVVGPRGAVLGQQDGSYELWLFPWKVFSNMRIMARMKDYPVPIDVNAHAAWIEVKPYATTFVFSHANFTIRETILAPKDGNAGTGAMMLYQIQAIRPMTLTFSFNALMQRMWPAESDDRPLVEWVSTGASGFYILREDFSGYAVAVAMPTAQPGILEPYQERVENYPLQFVLHFDPAKDKNKVYPLLLSSANTAAETQKPILAKKLKKLDAAVPAIYEANAAYYQKLLAARMQIDTPDKRLNDAFAWAEVSMDQLKVQTPDHTEEALTAGFMDSGDSVRPGFGWFFGRDALWSLYAINSEGDYRTTRDEIEFLLKRQGPDGKILHEWSQTAGMVAWKELPFEFAAADSTELLPMAMNDYVRISGDRDFLLQHWDAMERAWKFECTHDADGDGIYDNSEGSGWVESWIPKMPRQEIYVAALDEQASLAFANLARIAGHGELASAAMGRAEKIRQTIEKEYFLPQQNFYAFSWNATEGADDTATIFPSVAWWDGDAPLAHAGSMLSRWASSEFSTDWGTRILSDKVRFYDPISYHQGSVWPLFTGWVSVAEYRAGQALSGYAHLMQNAELTYAQDYGNTTELLSGQFFQPLGRSTAHQLWSSAMVISPVVRGMFGLEWDAQRKLLSVTPHLPANWSGATLRRIPFGNGFIDLTMARHGRELVVTAKHAPEGVRLASRTAGARVAKNGALSIPLPAVEVAVEEHLPEFGAETEQLKVLDEQYSAHALQLTLAAPGGTTQHLHMRANIAGLHVVCVHGVLAEAGASGLRDVAVTFPAAEGYATQTVILRW